MSFNNKVAIAMSGGVDSSTTALLLKRDGYDVVGVTAVMHDLENANIAAANAAKVSEILGIEHHVVDIREYFYEDVIKYFENSYENALTPNPCAVCNKKIKWGKLREFAKTNLGADLYATGHYVRTLKSGENWKLLRSADLKKDQTYMLFDLTQYDLSNTLFPLGNLTKSEVRKIANEANLPCAESKESQDICFILPPDSTQKYLKRKFSEIEGNIVEANTNKVLGKHKGYYNYTIGQRKGIGIAASEPLYVVKLDPVNNIVYVGFKEELAEKSLKVINMNWQQPDFGKNEFKAFVKIRYNSSAKLATVIPTSDSSAVINFDEAQYGITPGQAAVIYDLNNEYLIGGGWIVS